MTVPHSQLASEVTPVPLELQVLFDKWVRRNRITDLDAPESYYDYRGAFMAGRNRGKDGHWPDTWKQHGHPTFSVESKYALPNDPQAGHWEGETYVPPNGKTVRMPTIMLP